MTLEDLDAKFREASWLIAKRSTVAAGQALIFSAGSLDDAAAEVAAIYGLSEEQGLLSAETFEPILSSLRKGASAVGRQASAAWDGALDAGGQFAGATSGLFGRFSARFRKSPGPALSVEAEKELTSSSPPLSHSGGV